MYGRPLRYLSLFSGIGGFELGIERAHLRPSAYKPDDNGDKHEQERSWPACVGFSEIDKYAIQIYRSHFPDHPALGDITQLDAGTLPDVDMLVGGFPCQAFSVAGKRGGFSDTRGTLFFEIARIARAKRPRLLFLENVKGLLSHAEGATFYTIISTLDELGYDLQWQVLNSKDFGVPQNRERVFIVGHLRGTPRPEVFPLEGSGATHPLESGEPEPPVAPSLRSHHGGVDLDDQLVRTENKNGHGFENPYAGTLRAGASKNNNLVIRRQPLRFLDRNQKNIEGDYAFTVDSSQTSGLRVGDQVRRLTPIECERLQGFPDGWTEGVSDTQRYKCLGNAVTVTVIEAIATELFKETDDDRLQGTAVRPTEGVAS